MIAIGILLILVIAALIVGVILEGGDTSTIEVFNVEVTTSVTGFFAIGAGAAIVAVIGLWFVVAGVSRSRRRRREIQRLRRQADSAPERPAEEPAGAPAGAAVNEPEPGTQPTQPVPQQAHQPAPPQQQPAPQHASEPAADPYGTAMPPEPAPRPATETGSQPIPDQPSGDRQNQPNADWGPAHR